jgi:hypothetical protein
MRWGALVAVVALLVVGVAAYAVGKGTSSDDLTLCAAKSNGDLDLAENGKCAKSEDKVIVPVADGSLEAVNYVTGPANEQCHVKPGTFCKGTKSGSWGNGSNDYARAGFYKDSDGIVHLQGVASLESSGGHGGFQPEGPFYLPPAFQPSDARVYVVAGGQAFSGTTLVEVRPNGLVATPDPAAVLVSLDGISFRP